MKNFVNTTLAPYYEETKRRLHLPPHQRSLWQIDCWSVHRSEEFTDWMRDEHTTIMMNFVPARMTGLFQPADVGFQRLFKHFEGGKTASEISVDHKIGILRDRTVGWLWNAYGELNKPEIIKKAWEMCRAGDFNLSYESLTSREALQLLRELPNTDPEFFSELTRPRSKVPLLSAEEAEEEDQEVSELDFPGDDSAVPLAAVQDVVHGVHEVGADQAFVLGEDGLVSTAEAEEVLVEEVEDVVTDTTGTVAQEGRGQRKKFRNDM